MLNSSLIKQKTNLVRGDIYYADLCGVIGSEQGGTRPVLIIQNDMGNKYSPTTIVAAITSQCCKQKLPTHISLKKDESGLPKDSVALLEQIRTIDKSRLGGFVGHLSESQMSDIENALRVSFAMIILPVAV